MSASSTQIHDAALPAAADRRTPRAGVLGWLAGASPTVLVLLALAGLAVWGHETGWTLPKFSALLGTAGDGRDDWCAEHGVPASVCVACNPNLLPKPPEYGWCRTHGVHNCPLEHPEVAQLATVSPATTADLERARRALALTERPANSKNCKLYQHRIQFASAQAFQRAGVDVEPVWRAPIAEYVTANGELAYDQTRLAHLSARVPGSVWRVLKNTGEAVRHGEVVALVEAAEVGRAKADFLQAMAQFRLRERNDQSIQSLAGSGTLAERTLRESATALSEARIRLLGAQQALVNLGLPVDAAAVKGLSDTELAAHLQLLGLSGELRAALDPRTTTANLLPVRAPFDGIVVARNVAAGEVVDTTRVLCSVADVRQLWLTLHVRAEDARQVALGQPVRFQADSSGDEVTGTVTWISTEVDARTRTLKVRALVGNPAGRLRANVFGQGRIVLREEKDAIVVPSEAIHWEGDCYVVFVRDKNFLAPNGLKVFHTRTIRPGAKDDRYTEIIAGVLPGEVVATRGSGTLRAELLKNNLGEG